MCEVRMTRHRLELFNVKNVGGISWMHYSYAKLRVLRICTSLRLNGRPYGACHINDDSSNLVRWASSERTCRLTAGRAVPLAVNEAESRQTARAEESNA